MRSVELTHLREVVVVGAHCDDIAIGAGGTLLTVCAGHPGLRVRALVLSGAATARECEERAALRAFCPGADLDVVIADLPDGRMPGSWSQAKALVARLRRESDPELIIGPHRHDAHQDHRLLAELITQEFRDHLVLGYEIPKYENDLAPTNTHVGLSDEVVDTKISLLRQHYPSQHARSWFDDETFRAVLRLRGVHAQRRWAEAFVIDKLQLVLGRTAGPKTDDQGRTTCACW